MKTLYSILASVLLLAAIQTAAFGQTVNITETFKKHFNETALEVQDTDDADEKRAILSESFNKMIRVIDRIEATKSLTGDEKAQLASYKLGITDKMSELNGEDGFDELMDKDLNDFSDYSQDYIEQADGKTITIGITTVLLVVIILLLL